VEVTVVAGHCVEAQLAEEHTALIDMDVAFDSQYLTFIQLKLVEPRA